MFGNLTYKQKLSLIESLLKFKDDTDYCAIKIKSFEPKLSSVYPLKSQKYSIQLEALYLINIIYFEDPFKYSPYPILCDKSKQVYETIDGELIKLAYKFYEDWFTSLKKEEGTDSKFHVPLPVNGDVFWLR